MAGTFRRTPGIPSHRNRFSGFRRLNDSAAFWAGSIQGRQHLLQINFLSGWHHRRDRLLLATLSLFGGFLSLTAVIIFPCWMTSSPLHDGHNRVE
jgi:hypothetical protein